MNEREGFYAAIRANRADDTVRLVFADWLQEYGEDELAAFIRAQVWLWANSSCGSCTGPEWSAGKPCAECDRRESLRGQTAVALFGQGRWREWAGPARDLVPAGAQWDDHLQFARGLLTEVSCTASGWLKTREAVRAAHPALEAVTLTDFPERLRDPATGLWVAFASPARLAQILEDLDPGVRFTLPPEPVPILRIPDSAFGPGGSAFAGGGRIPVERWAVSGAPVGTRPAILTELPPDGVYDLPFGAEGVISDELPDDAPPG